MTVLAAVEGEHVPDKVIEIGYDVADAYGDELVVLHVMPVEDFEERQLNREEYFIDNAETDAAEVARRVVRETIGSSEGIEVMGEVGEVTQAILDTGDELDARFLVVGGRKQTPVGKVLFGSTVQSLLLHSERPVVAVFQDLD